MKKGESRWLNTTSFKVQDEYYTSSIMVYPIIKYLKKGSTIWCPFDTENSEFVHILQDKGFKVLYSHLLYGQDFFNYYPREPFDYIISNPPFTKKLEVFERLYQIGKPFAMLMGLTILNYHVVGDFFLGKELQLLVVNKKISFNGKTSSFNTSYFCYNLLPKDLIFTHIDNNNANKYYIPSRMYLDFKKGD